VVRGLLRSREERKKERIGIRRACEECAKHLRRDLAVGRAALGAYPDTMRERIDRRGRQVGIGRIKER